MSTVASRFATGNSSGFERMDTLGPRAFPPTPSGRGSFSSGPFQGAWGPSGPSSEGVDKGFRNGLLASHYHHQQQERPKSPPGGGVVLKGMNSGRGHEFAFPGLERERMVMTPPLMSSMGGDNRDQSAGDKGLDNRSIDELFKNTPFHDIFQQKPLDTLFSEISLEPPRLSTPTKPKPIYQAQHEQRGHFGPMKQHRFSGQGMGRGGMESSQNNYYTPRAPPSTPVASNFSFGYGVTNRLRGRQMSPNGDRSGSSGSGSGSSSRSSSSPPLNTQAVTQPLKKCVFCRGNNQPDYVYKSHPIRLNDTVICPALRTHVCGICGATGDNAHTIKYCPFNNRGYYAGYRSPNGNQAQKQANNTCLENYMLPTPPPVATPFPMTDNAASNQCPPVAASFMGGFQTPKNNGHGVKLCAPPRQMDESSSPSMMFPGIRMGKKSTVVRKLDFEESGIPKKVAKMDMAKSTAMFAKNLGQIQFKG